MSRTILVLGLAIAIYRTASAETVGYTRSSPGTATLNSCELMDSPLESQGHTSSWDRQQTNEDLMVEEMHKGKYNAKDVKVAVIDGAFDIRAKSQINGQVLLDGAPVTPKLSHATSVIAHITRAAPGTTVKNYPLMERSDPSPADILKMATRACADGYQVINLSVYSPGGAILSTQQQLRSALEARGCILVQASGNDQDTQKGRDGTKNDIRPWAFNDEKILTVSASDIDGGRGKFSAPGVLRAPGADVPILDPTNQKLTGSGSSFSAPAVSGIVKNILTILHTAKPKLSELDMPTLVSRIVHASKVNEIADGYRAVILAKAVVAGGAKDLLGNVKSQETFAAAAFQQEAKRIGLPGKCENLQPCERRTCYQEKRKLIALTGKATLADVEDLWATTGASNDPSLSTQWSNARTKLLSSGSSPAH